MATLEENEDCHQVQNIGVRLNLKNFIFISCGVTELIRKVCFGGGGVPQVK